MLPDFPLHPGERQRLRDANTARLFGLAAREAARHQHSLKCAPAHDWRPPSHAGQEDGCANNGTTCLCECHDQYSDGVDRLAELRAAADHRSSTHPDYPDPADERAERDAERPGLEALQARSLEVPDAG